MDERKIVNLFNSWEGKSILKMGALHVYMASWLNALTGFSVPIVGVALFSFLDVSNGLYFFLLMAAFFAMLPRVVIPKVCFRTKCMEYGDRSYNYNKLERIEYSYADAKKKKGKHIVLHFATDTFDLKYSYMTQEEMDALLQLFGTCFNPIFINDLLYEDLIRLFADVIALKNDSSYQNAELQCVQKYFLESKYRDRNYCRDLRTALLSFNKYKAMKRLPKGEGYMNICLSIMGNKAVDYAERLDILSHLFECKYASDGMVDEAELERLSRIAFYLCIKDWDFLSLKYRFEAEKQTEDQRKGSENTQQRERYQSVCSSRKREAYNLLGLRFDASLEEVKSAYRTLVKTCHPDTLPPTAKDKEREEATLRFRTVTEAYDFLCEELVAEPVSMAR